MSFQRDRFYSSSRAYNDSHPYMRQHSGGEERLKGQRSASLATASKPGLSKISKMFRGGKKGDKGRLHSGFDDVAIRPASPDSSPVAPFTRDRIRSHSVGSRVGMKVRKGKDRGDVFFMWKPVRVRKELFRKLVSSLSLSLSFREENVNGKVFQEDS